MNHSGSEGFQKPLLFSDRALLQLICPLVIEQTLVVLVGMADTVMVSTVGEAAISGVSLVDMINNLIINIFAALATGGAVVTSQFIGAADMDRAEKSASQLVFLSALLGLMVMSFCILLRHGMLRLFFGSIEDSVMEAALLYFLITAFSYPFLALYNAGAAIFRSLGNSAVSMRVSALMNLFNIAGNAFCIFVLRMGVAGVAVPTLLSRMLGALIILRLASSSHSSLRLQPAHILHLQPSMVRKILYIGIPSAFENSLFQLGRVVVVSMIALFGTIQISANAVANNIDGIGIIIGQAMGLAMITVTGRAVGAKDEAQVRYFIKKILRWTYLAQDTVDIIILVTLPLILRVYTLSPETVALTTKLVFIHLGAGLILWPAGFTLPHALRASNDIRFTMTVSILSMLCWRVLFSYILCVRLEMGAIGVWIAMIIDWICRTICFVGRYRSGRWKEHAGLS